jgi:N6-L-threonylcarbamoyladenine synthase
LLYAEIEASISIDSIDAIAVTQGPGLKGCLLMGYHFAQGLAMALNKPLLGVNHIEGHILAPLLDEPNCKPPYLALVVSGGHTELLMFLLEQPMMQQVRLLIKAHLF